MDVDKPVPVVIIPPVRFIYCPTRQKRTGTIQGACDPEILVYVITTMGVPVEETLAGIGTKIINLAIRMECDSEASWVTLLG